MKLTFILMLLLYGTQVWSHGKEKHGESPVKKVEETHHDTIEMKKVAESINLEINEAYLREVKPIFKKSCFDCHGSVVNYPWYYKIPGVKQMIDSDIREAKKHFDFSEDYPFKSHDSQLNDLKSISKAVKDGAMPPFDYSLMHNNSKLTDQEKSIIETWIKQSIKKLNNEK